MYFNTKENIKLLKLGKTKKANPRDEISQH